MPSLFPRLIVAVLSILLSVSIASAEDKGNSYKLILLPAVESNSATVAIDVNETGEVLGYDTTRDPFNPRAFVWSRRAGYIDIPIEQLAEQFGVQPGRSVVAKINNKGEVAGYLLYNPSQERYAGSIPFLWSADRGFQQILNPPMPDVLAQARAVNDGGQVAGDIDLHAFRWSEQGGLQALGALGQSGSQSSARGINNIGSVVGMAIAPTQPGAWHAFLWRANSGMRDLGTLPGYANSDATAVSDRGQIVGYSYDPGRRAFIWSDRTGLEELSTQGSEFQDLYPADINNHSVVVGNSNGRAVIWTEATGPIDLNTLIDDTTVALENASAISNRGLIVGTAKVGFIERGFLLIPNGEQCPKHFRSNETEMPTHKSTDAVAKH